MPNRLKRSTLGANVNAQSKKKAKTNPIPPQQQPQLQPQLAYNFTVPYQGGCQLEIINSGNEAVAVGNISFVTNCQLSGNPWGPLWAWGATMTNSTNSDGIHITYSITEPQNGVTIPANSSATLSYGYTTANGPMNIGMNPTAVDVTVAGSTTPVSVPIEGLCQGSSCNDPNNGKINGVYYADWDMYAEKFNADQIPYDQVNQVVYAFVSYDQYGNVTAYDPNSDSKNLVSISIARQQNPYLNASLSVGGWTLSSDFSALAANPTARQNFITNMIAAMRASGFNGIDIDWEYPTAPQDTTNWATLLTEFRAALDTQGKTDNQKYYLSIAAPAGIDKIQAIAQNNPQAWSIVQQAVDRINLMSYDFHGAFDAPGPSDHQSAMQTATNDPYYQNPITRYYNVQAAVTAYQKLGFNNSQIIVGIPAYWRTEYVVSSINNGLYQNITGTPPGQFNDGTGVYNYPCVIGLNCDGGLSLPADMQFYYDSVAQVYYGFSPSTKIFATGDNLNSTVNKAQYAVSNNLGGVFYWDASGAITNDTNSLVAASHNIFAQQTNPQSTVTSEAASPECTHEVVLRTIPEAKETPVNKANIAAGNCYVGKTQQGVEVLSCVGPEYVVQVFPKLEGSEVTSEASKTSPVTGDVYHSCRPLEDSVVCEGEKTTIKYTPVAPPVTKFFDNLDSQIALGATIVYGLSQFKDNFFGDKATAKEQKLYTGKEFKHYFDSLSKDLAVLKNLYTEKQKLPLSKSDKNWLDRIVKNDLKDWQEDLDKIAKAETMTEQQYLELHGHFSGLKNALSELRKEQKQSNNNPRVYHEPQMARMCFLPPPVHRPAVSHPQLPTPAALKIGK